MAQRVAQYVNQELKGERFPVIDIRAIAGDFYLVDKDDKLLDSPSFRSRQEAEQARSKALDIGHKRIVRVL